MCAVCSLVRRYLSHRPLRPPPMIERMRKIVSRSKVTGDRRSSSKHGSECYLRVHFVSYRLAQREESVELPAALQLASRAANRLGFSARANDDALLASKPFLCSETDRSPLNPKSYHFAACPLATSNTTTTIDAANWADSGSPRSGSVLVGTPRHFSPHNLGRTLSLDIPGKRSIRNTTKNKFVPNVFVFVMIW